MALFDAVHHFEVGRIEIVHWPNAAQHRVPHSCRPVHGEAHPHQAIDDRLYLRLLGALLHND